ncbi:unnamed protein product [Vitrella brassicaformis CCMP3155]|uniref:Protein kinase domain-containing protein n=1 Tax=Vitrella brassicaformis (strain CCMP3155) TaxID=1169540 RepID=A0A0G4FCY2_VITBC|nr:unnamed protein product [Vitrella brassicaformis CCMP3155]|eukprot:CEM11026.1 unnamed protein product [Vitrella brassicaformis CCMP3155]
MSVWLVIHQYVETFSTKQGVTNYVNWMAVMHFHDKGIYLPDDLRTVMIDCLQPDAFSRPSPSQQLMHMLEIPFFQERWVGPKETGPPPGSEAHTLFRLDRYRPLPGNPLHKQSILRKGSLSLPRQLAFMGPDKTLWNHLSWKLPRLRRGSQAAFRRCVAWDQFVTLSVRLPLPVYSPVVSVPCPSDLTQQEAQHQQNERRQGVPQPLPAGHLVHSSSATLQSSTRPSPLAANLPCVSTDAASARLGSQMVVWVGAECPNVDAAKEEVRHFKTHISRFEGIPSIDIHVCRQGQEDPFFWRLLDLNRGSHDTSVRFTKRPQNGPPGVFGSPTPMVNVTDPAIAPSPSLPPNKLYRYPDLQQELEMYDTHDLDDG